MRVLFFNYEFPPLGGGAGNATYYLLKEFSKDNNLKIDLVTSSVNEFKVEKFSDNIDIHYLNIGKKGNLHYQSMKDLLIYAWKSYFYGKKLLKNGNYNLIHVFFGIPCGFVAMLLKKPYIVSLRGSDVPFYNERFKCLDKLLFKRLSRKIWRKANAVIANSEGLKKLALKTNPNQEIEIIYNGIDTEQFKTPESHRANQFKILCVTRLISRKGVKYLIEAFKRLSEKSDNISLEIIGDGDEKEHLENLARELKIENKIEFTGLIMHEKLPPYFGSADIFVLPSLNEGMSNSMLEALASGLPLIATDIGGTRELVEEGRNGFIIKTESPQDIAEKIQILIDDPDLRRKMGEESRAKAEKMSWGNVAKEYTSIYYKINELTS